MAIQILNKKRKQGANRRVIRHQRRGENSKRMEGRDARTRGCYGDLVRFQRSQRWPRSLYIPFYRFPREENRRGRERKRDTVNPGDNPGVWPYYISQRGGGLLLDDFNGGAPGAHSAHPFLSPKEQESRDSLAREIMDFLEAAVAPTGRCIRRNNRGRESMNFPHEWNHRALSRVLSHDESARFSRVFPRAISALACAGRGRDARD